MTEKEKCNNVKIRILENGPYEVCGEVSIRQEKIIPDTHGWAESREKGKEYKTVWWNEDIKVSHLCRCWHSKNKPYCDGTHGEIWFEGTEYASKEPYEQWAMYYQWPELDLIDKENLCAVARFCHLWKGTRKSVMQGENKQDKENAITSACNCPSGRLTVVDKKGNMIEPKLEPEIWIVEDLGKDCKWPLRVQGNIEVESSDGENYPVRNRQTLCRCGESRNMPFCDASHLRCEHMQGVDQE